MTPRKTRQPLNAQLVKLGEAVGTAGVRVRQLEADHAKARDDAARIAEERVEAFSRDDADAAERLAAQRSEAETLVAELGERLEGARRAQQRAKSQQAEYATHNLAGLIHERRQDGEQAAQAVRDALQALQDAHRAWLEVETQAMGVMRLAGESTRDQPRLPVQLEALLRDVKRAAGGVHVPVPLPTGFSGGRFGPAPRPSHEERPVGVG